MAVNYTTLLGLTQPVNGTEAGTWGDDVNSGVTALVDTAIAGATTFSASATLSVTQGAANTFRQAIIIVSGNTGAITLTAPASKTKTYIVLNESAYGCTIIASGVGTTVPAGVYATVACDGTNYYTVASSADATAAAVAQATANTANTTANAANATVNAISADYVSKSTAATQSITSSVGIGGTTKLGTAATLLPLQVGDGSTSGTTVINFARASALSDPISIQAITAGVGTANLLLQPSGGNLGLGTASPSYKLDVRGAIAGGNGTIIGGISYSTRPEIGALSNHPVGFISNGVTQMLLDISGNLGLGTASPVALFGKTLQISDGASEGSLSIVGSTASGYLVTTGGALNLVARGGFPLKLGSNDAIQATLDTSGNLGVGTAAPAYKLDVVGVANCYATRVGFSAIAPGVAGSGGLYTTSPGVYGYGIAANLGSGGLDIMANQPGAGRIRFWTGGSDTVPVQTMQLDASGNLGIGVTPSGSFKLEVAGGLKATGLNFSSGGASLSPNTATIDTDGAGVMRSYSRGANTSTVGAFNWHNQSSNGSIDTTAMTLDTSGNLLVGATAPVNIGGITLSKASGIARISVQSTVAGNSDASLYLECAGANAGEIKYTRATSNLDFLNGGSTKMSLDGSGNLGIGVTPSAWGASSKAVEVGALGNAVFSNSGSVNLCKNVYVDTSNYRYAAPQTASLYQQVNGAHGWYTAVSGPAGTIIPFTPAMALDASSNLAITGTVTATNLFGQSQTYTDVTASRAASTTYTNSTVRPIRVEIIIVGTGTNQGTITVDGLTTGQVVGAVNATRQYTFVVKPGATYNAGVTGTIQKWFELR